MAKYNTLDEFMTSIDDPAHVQKLAALIQWALDRFPTLLLRIAWNQPMLTDHGTFIIGFSAATNHISIAVEDKTLDLYRDTITQAGYKSSKRLFQM
ncbi:iron chaperone [Lacticaseibacillus saniviri]|nr:iron chaperone [Lacticaseibacillus saniviri]MCG4280793.1 iron chaperone [Lacticaseibacillus saniviri]